MIDTNPRVLIQRLSNALNDLSEHLEAETPAPTVQNAHKVWKEARAYLAQSEPEEPTDEEILALSHEHEVSYTMCDGHVIYPKQEGCDMRDDVLSFARDVLSRWGK